jgi:hypothetical protein
MSTTQDMESASSNAGALPKPNAALLHPHIDAGHELIPLHPPSYVDNHGRTRGKSPRDSNWRHRDYRSESAAKWMATGNNVDVRLRPDDLVIDIDPRNFPEGDNVKSRFASDFSLKLDDIPRTITGAGGDHYYLRKSANLLVRHALDDYPGIEFKTHGAQVVAAGSTHPLTGQHYRIDDIFGDLRSPPEVPYALCAVIARSERVSTGHAGLHTREELVLMLEGLDPRDYNSNEAWFPLLAASHHATGGAGCDEFVEWSLRDADYAGREWEIRRRWESLSSEEGKRVITFKTLYDQLHRHNQGHRIPHSAVADDFINGAAEFDARGVGVLSEEAALSAMNRRHFTALVGGKHNVGIEGSHPTLGINQVQFFSDGAVRRHYDRAFVEATDADGEKAKRTLGSFWLAHPLRRAYDGVVFDPMPGRSHPRLYNRWRGWAYDPNPNGSWDRLKHLLRNVLCGGDDKAYSYMLRWSAFMVQKPHRPAEVAVVVRGPKGLGKGTYFRALHHLAGAHGKHILNAEHFTGRFNEHLMDCIFLLVDEGFWAGDKRHEGVLKGLITEPVLTFEPKGQPIVQGPNLLHIAIASNEDWVVPATLDERRFAILDVNPNVPDASSKEFFDELYRELENGGYGAMLNELLHIDLGSWHPRYDVPRTRGLAEQKIESFRQNPIAAFWLNTLEEGVVPVPDDTDEDWSRNAVTVDSTRKWWIVRDVNQYAKRLGRREEVSKTAVARFLSQVGVRVHERDARGNRIWSIPPLAEARTRFEELFGSPYPWDDGWAPVKAAR